MTGMATAFTRTLRRLEPGGLGRPIRNMAIAAGIIGAWTAWGVLSRLTLYEASSQGRLEIDHAIHSVEVPAGGRVAESFLALGREVQAGDVLLRLESDTERYALREEQEKLTALAPELAALRAQAASLTQARQDEASAAET